MPLHRSTLVVLLISAGIALSTPAQSQETLFPGLAGEALVLALRAAYAPTAVLSYGPARDSLFAWEDRTTGSLRGVYSGYTIQLTPGVDPTEDAAAKGINTEHTWPRSRGTDSGPAFSDLHHLFPTRDAVNTARSNHPFAEIPDALIDTWYRLDQSQSSVPSFALDEWSERDGQNPDPAYSGRFEPREDHAGDAARAVFYVHTVYGPQLEDGFFEAQVADLLAWHKDDPVSAFEADRNIYIASLQGNENPFLLDSTLARRAFGDGGSGPPGGGTGELLISEYVEGSSFNKAVELYNPSATEAVDLGASGYRLEVFFNGSTSAGTTISLLGVVQPGDVFVVASSQADPAILAEADLTTGASLFNGNDAVVLTRDDGAGGRETLDAVGQVGFDPGEEWGSGLTSTKDNTLRRRADACEGDSEPGDAFDPGANYVGFATNTFGGLGTADLDCASAPPVVAEIEPVGAPSVPASGGPISYTVTLTNTSAESQTVTARVDATLPAGGTFGPLQGPQTLTLAPGQAVGPAVFTESVPLGAPSGTYTITLTLEVEGNVIASDSFTFEKKIARSALLTEDETEAVEVYPNPSAAGTTFQFSLVKEAPVRLVVYDLIGRELAVLAGGILAVGDHMFLLDVRDLPNGAYVWRLERGAGVRTGRFVVGGR